MARGFINGMIYSRGESIHASGRIAMAFVLRAWFDFSRMQSLDSV